MNPKAILAPQMFGFLDFVSNEWTEGIFASLWRKANKDKKHFTWLVLDGPVDAIWIENMNTVMDDNKVRHPAPLFFLRTTTTASRCFQILTLANNDRIPMHFEVEDLRNASPATVSRAGIIYVSLADLGWLPMVQSWIAGAKRPARADGGAHQVLRHSTCSSLLDLPRLRVHAVHVRDARLARDLHVRHAAGAHRGDRGQGGPRRADGEVLERFFIYSLIWSVAGILETKDRQRVDKHLRTLTKNLPTPAEGTPDTVYEYKVDDATGDWVHWGVAHPGVGAAARRRRSPSSSRAAHPDDRLGAQRVHARPLHRAGALHALHRRPGHGEDVDGAPVPRQDRQGDTMFKKMSFSSATTPSIFQRQIESSVEKRQGKTYGPPGNKKMLVFIDDISMPAYNEWGDQITLEIVRQLMEYGGMYNLDKPGEFKYIKDLLMIGCMLQPGGGKNDISCMPGMLGGRAKRHFHVMNVTLPSVGVDQPDLRLAAQRAVRPRGGGQDRRGVGDVGPARRDDHQHLGGDQEEDAADARQVPLHLQPARPLARLPGRLHVRRGRGAQVGHAAPRPLEARVRARLRRPPRRLHRQGLVRQDDRQAARGPVRRAKGASLKEPMYFVDFLRDGDEDPDTGEELPPPHIYEPVAGLAECRERVQMFVGRFNEAFKLNAVDIVLFDDALLHFMRIARIMRTPRGSALLVGVGGSGKQTLTRLGAYVAGATFFQSTITKQYNANNLLEDFKPLYMQAGVKGKGAAFIFTDKEIKEESFLEYVNIFLNTGELPNLFARDEMDAIYGEAADRVRQVALRRRRARTRRRTTCGPSSSTACAPTCTSSSASRPSAPSSTRARRSSPRSSTAAPSTGSCRGPRRRSPTSRATSWASSRSRTRTRR